VTIEDFWRLVKPLLLDYPIIVAHNVLADLRSLQVCYTKLRQIAFGGAHAGGQPDFRALPYSASIFLTMIFPRQIDNLSFYF